MLKWSKILQLVNTFKYLAAWFLLSDGFSTITSTTVFFAKASSLILIGIITPLSGILGSLLWPQIQRTFSLSNLTILDILVLLATLIPLYDCLGFLFPSFSFRLGGLVAPGEMPYKGS